MIRNSVIENVSLEIEDRGLLTCWLTLEVDGGLQGFGGYRLDGPCNYNYGAETIKRILDTLQVKKWENLPGTPVRVDGDYEKIHRIGHFLKDQWFDFTRLKYPDFTEGL
jgi:hypothetical protein